jgi:hypothetical protein
LHSAIDDAAVLCVTENERLEGYFEAMRRTRATFGALLVIYSGRRMIFRPPKMEKPAEKGEAAHGAVWVGHERARR